MADDEEGEEAFFKEFEEMFFGSGSGMFGGMDGDFDEFTTFLESDTKFMRKMMRDLGKNARTRGKRRKGGAVGGGASAGGINMNIGGDIDDMLNFFMMPGMAMGGMGMPFGGTGAKPKAKKPKKKKDEDDGWATEEDELDEEDGISKKGDK